MDGLMMDYQLTVTALLKRARQLYGNCEIATRLPSVAMHRYTYRDCYARVCRLANALVRLGVERGDRVGTMAWNNHEHLELYYGIPCLGAVIHTINIRYSPEQLVYTINHAEDELVFVDATLLPLAEAIAPHLKTVKQYVLIGAPRDIKTTLSPVLHYEDLLEGESDSFNWPELDENTAAGLCYTSGTTGNPKGALYSHRTQFLLSMAGSMNNGLGLTTGDTIFVVVPMFHANAWGLPYSSAMSGVRQILPGPHLKPTDLAQMIQDEKVTFAAGVPTLWIGLYHELKARRYDIGHLKALLVGGAAMPKSLIQAYEEEFGIRVLHAWGMTEMSPLGSCTGTLTHRDDLSREEYYNRKARQGAAAPCVEIRIVDEDGYELPWDDVSVGEVQVRGPCVIRSYFRDPEGDSKFTKDGWFVTGDVAAMDSTGSMRLTDRTKDLIKSGGEWISSVELESALMAHPKVLEAAVIAVPDEKWSERPLACVVPKPGEHPTKEELLEFISGQFAKFWLPDEVVFVTEIPKTSVGKFDKKVLRQRRREGAL